MLEVGVKNYRASALLVVLEHHLYIPMVRAHTLQIQQKYFLCSEVFISSVSFWQHRALPVQHPLRSVRAGMENGSKVPYLTASASLRSFLSCSPAHCLSFKKSCEFIR